MDERGETDGKQDQATPLLVRSDATVTKFIQAARMRCSPLTFLVYGDTVALPQPKLIFAGILSDFWLKGGGNY